MAFALLLAVLVFPRAEAVASDAGGPSGAQCAGASPPPPAAAAGLTKLAFCDDFSSNSIAAGPDPASRDIVGGKKWTTELGFDNTRDVMSEVSLKWNGDGSVTIDPDRQKYQWYMTSVAKRGNALNGYFIDRKKRWYAEVRWRFDRRGGGQPAFWSMDTCHTFHWPDRCTLHDSHYIEPDFWEYFDAVTSVHYYQQSFRGGQIKKIRCIKTNRKEAVQPGEWFVAGHLFTSDPPMQRYYKNERLFYTRTTATDGCKDFGGGDTASFIAEMVDGRYPLHLGAKDGDVITYDYVRVWEHPDD